jgi:hypothetical protein
MARTPTRRLIRVLAWLAVSFAAPAANASPLPPPDLSGERLVNLSSWSPQFVSAEDVEACSTNGTAHVPFRFEAVAFDGRAFGPYPGTFEETGVVTIGPRTSTTTDTVGVEIGAGPVLGFRSTFRIESGGITIEGVKRLDASAPAVISGCDTFVNAPSELNPGRRFTGFAIQFEFLPVRYRARITTPAGSHLARGSGVVFLIAGHFTTSGSEGSALGFTERFH